MATQRKEEEKALRRLINVVSKESFTQNADEFLNEEQIIACQRALIKKCSSAVASVFNEANPNSFSNDELSNLEQGICLKTDRFGQPLQIDDYYSEDIKKIRHIRDEFTKYLAKQPEGGSLGLDFDEARNDENFAIPEQLRKAIVNYNKTKALAGKKDQMIAMKEETITSDGEETTIFHLPAVPNPYIGQINERIAKRVKNNPELYVALEENGAKTKASIMNKQERGIAFKNMTDVNRIRIVVNSPKMADKIINKIKSTVNKSEFAGEYWRANERGFMDRQVHILIDGRICEVQFVPKQMVEVYNPSHRIYELSRTMKRKIERDDGKKITRINGDLLNDDERTKLLTDYKWLKHYLESWLKLNDDNDGQRFSLLGSPTPDDFKGDELYERFEELENASRLMHETARKKMTKEFRDIRQDIKFDNPQPAMTVN